MAEGGRSGSALRVYQVAAILALGWLAGRLPGLLSANDEAKQQLRAAIGSTAGPAKAADDQAMLAADVAARVAAQVAEETIGRLIAAGWGPRNLSLAELPALPGAGPPRETIVRVVTEAAAPVPAPAPVQQAWSIPPASPPAAPAGPVAAPQSLAAAARPVGDGRASRAHGLATAGYAALEAGNRREAVALLDEAARLAPDADGAGQWRADLAQLTKRWSIAGYVLSRSGGVNDPLAASPVLGGGQAGVAAGYVLNPLADARVSVIGRVSAASKASGALDNTTAEAALGLRLQPFRGVPLAIDAERRIALGVVARNGWAVRVAGGDSRDVQLAGRTFRVDSYGEAGAIGFRQTALYGGGQLRAGTALLSLGKVTVDGGAGLWGAAQRDYGRTSSRLDVGPSAQFRIHPWPFRAQVDYRVQAAGNAVPKSGPVITVSGEF